MFVQAVDGKHTPVKNHSVTTVRPDHCLRTVRLSYIILCLS